MPFLCFLLLFQDSNAPPEPVESKYESLAWGATVAAGFGDLFHMEGETIEQYSAGLQVGRRFWFGEVEIQEATTLGHTMHLFDLLGGVRTELEGGPYFLCSAGFSWNDAEDATPFLLGGPFNFVLRVAAGIQVRLGPASLLVELRITHWSNAGIDEPNVGLNVAQIAATLVFR